MRRGPRSIERPRPHGVGGPSGPLAVTNATAFEWTDSSSSNVWGRFYILGDMADDPDGDGYSSSRESLLSLGDPAEFDYIDSDADGLHDWFEWILFGTFDQTASDDYDSDGLTNGEEMVTTSTNVTFSSDPTNPDTDGDGLGDAEDPEPNTATELVAVDIKFKVYGGPDSSYQLKLEGPGDGIGFTHIYHQGADIPLEKNLIKGESYTLTIDRLSGTNGYSATVSGADIVIEDNQDTLGDHLTEELSSDARTAAIHLPQVLLAMSSNTMTLKHDNQCQLNVVTKPEGLAFTNHWIGITPTFVEDSRRYTLTETATYAWTTKVAGTFKLDAWAYIGEERFEAAPQHATVQFPSYTQITNDAVVIADMEALWAQTIAASTPTSITEFAFIIYYDAQTDAYVTEDVIPGEECVPGEQASVKIQYVINRVENPLKEDAKYVVADFHTHPPYTDGPPPGQPAGPSDEDIQEAKKEPMIPSFVYDYDVYKVPGHSKTNSAHIWHYGVDRREFF